MQFIVEAAGVAHRVPIRITPPECGGGRLTVSTTGACSSGCRLEEYQTLIRAQENKACMQNSRIGLTF